MKHKFSHRPFAALLLMLAATAIISCEKDKENPTGGTPQNPEQPVQEPFTLSGTAWLCTHDEWWTAQMHVIDTTIWSFDTESTGTIYQHRIYNNDDPYGGQLFPMTYTFDTMTMTGILYGYKESDGSIYPLPFTYHEEDSTLTYEELSNINIYHLIK
ncbi:MAG: hypothetical protein J6I49_09195 [Bacteroidales bacterium]|nr:hypothetical protein [Bacteroidales bacterium]